MFGFSFNAYSMPIDTVIRGEFAFFPNQPWNYGTHTLIGLPKGTYPWFPFGDTGIRVPGLSGVIEKIRWCGCWVPIKTSISCSG